MVPSVTSVTGQSFGAASGDKTVTLPTTAAGDLLILIVGCDDDNVALTGPGGSWVEVFNGDTGNLWRGIWALIATGAESGGSVTINIAAAELVDTQIYRIAAGTHHADISPIGDTITFGASANDGSAEKSPPSVAAPGGVSGDLLSIVGSNISANDTDTFACSGYGNEQRQTQGSGSAGHGLYTLRRTLVGSSEDAGVVSWGGDTSPGQDFDAWCILVKGNANQNLSMAHATATASAHAITHTLGAENFNLAHATASASAHAVSAAQSLAMTHATASASGHAVTFTETFALAHATGSGAAHAVLASIAWLLAHGEAAAEAYALGEPQWAYGLAHATASAQAFAVVADLACALALAEATAEAYAVEASDALTYDLAHASATAQAHAITAQAGTTVSLSAAEATAEAHAVTFTEDFSLAHATASASASAIVAAVNCALALATATAEAYAVVASDTVALEHATATGAAYAVVVAIQAAMGHATASAVGYAIARGGVTPGDPRVRLPSGSALLDNLLPAGTAVSRPRLSPGSSLE